MKLYERHIKKIDPLLRDALRHAKGDEVLRAVMVLGPASGDVEEDDGGQELDPAQFPSREAYRQALIGQRQRQLAHKIGDTLQELQRLSLTPHGGMMSRTVVVEGSARQILTSLELLGVRHASLDQPIELIEPRRQGRGQSKR